MKILEITKKNKSFLAGLLVLFAFRWSFADQYRVPSGSMQPTLQIGDHIAVDKMAYGFKIPFINNIVAQLSEPQRGDIVVFTWPGDHETTYVKRLIGLPGDHLQIEDGFITLNGKPLEGSAQGQAALAAAAQQEVTYTETLGDHHYQVQRLRSRAGSPSVDMIIPADHYFFMGDNRDQSSDSRYWGLVEREALKGRALSVLWNIRFEDFWPQMDLKRILKKAS